jgi:hypothetical protein
LSLFRWPVREEKGTGDRAGRVKETSIMAESDSKKSILKLNPFHTF